MTTYDPDDFFKEPIEEVPERCFYCGREGEPGSFNSFGGHPWCEMDDCHPSEDFFDKADRLYDKDKC